MLKWQQTNVMQNIAVSSKNTGRFFYIIFIIVKGKSHTLMEYIKHYDKMGNTFVEA